jgi:nitrous oxidase accessory protein NosD
MMRKLEWATIGLLAAGFAWCQPALAVVCQVPSGTHPTIQAAVNDDSCTEIELAAQTFEESVLIARGLTLRGASQATTTVEGQIAVQGVATEVVVEELTVDASARGMAGTVDAALVASGGASLITHSVSVLNSAVDLWAVFDDGFESGDTSAWSDTVP